MTPTVAELMLAQTILPIVIGAICTVILAFGIVVIRKN